MGRGTPHTLPHRGLRPLSTLRSQVWTSPYAYDAPDDDDINDDDDWRYCTANSFSI